GQKFPDIFLAAIEIRLDHRADRRISCAHTLDEVDGTLRVGRAFHINAQKIIKTGGALHDGEHQARAKFTVDVQTELREFAGDVGLEVFLGDGLENREILVAGTLCVRGAGNILAEIIQASRHTDRKSTRLNSSHVSISYAVFCLKKKKKNT